MTRSIRFVLVAGMVSACLAGRLSGETTWTGGAGNRDWFAEGNWSSGVPGPGEDVVISSGSDVLLTNETAQLGALSMSGGTLTFSNWFARVQAATIAISGGTITLPPAFTNNAMSNRVWFVSTGDFTLAQGAVINVNGKGYARGKPLADGNGPGGGHSCEYGSGAGHGGRGGFQGNGASSVGGIIYGSYAAPEAPGSGGATRDAGWQAGDGGGAVRISAGGCVVLNGTITANGVRNGIYSGGGSGGSIYIDCRTFAGNGAVMADGNSVSQGGGGGAGGRIAIVYDAPAQSNEPPFAVTFSARGGSGAYQNLLSRNGELGTLYFPDAPLLTETIALPHVGRLVMPGTTAWAPDSLTVTGACALVFPDGFTVTVASDCLIKAGTLDLGWGGEMHVGGSVTLTNGGALKIRSAPTNDVTAVGARLAVTNDITIANGAWLYLYCDPTNGGAPLVACRDVDVLSSDAGIRADYGGFKGGSSGVSAKGSGPGGGWGGNYGGGGAYGGQGSLGGAMYGWSQVYGSDTNVLLPGSGGGSYSDGNGGEAGGLVRLIASGDITLNGTISADGYTGSFYSGGGSGGGIDLTCRTLSGTGTIRANGGAAAHIAGGGGGGRICVRYDAVAQSNASPAGLLFSAAGGAGGGGNPAGEKGTIFFPPILREQVDRPHVGRVVLPGLTGWTPASLAVGVACDLELPDDFQVSVSGDVSVVSGQYGFGPGSEVSVGGNVILTNNGRMVLRGGFTNGVDSTPGALLEVAGDLVIYSNAWLMLAGNKTNGGAPLIRARNVLIPQSTGGISSDMLGFLGGNKQGYGNDGPNGLGPGKGLQLGYGGGGGHGGAGGDCSAAGSKGLPNGYTNAPAVGSGGAEGASYGPGGNGGGRIRVEAAGTILVNGLVTANGETAGYYGGGGSGGGIWMIARRFAGTGTVRAHGGNSNNKGGAGGGGRIALWRGGPYTPEMRALLEQDQPVPRVETVASFDGFATVTATNGVGGSNPGQPGTIVYLVYSARPGSLIILQ